MTTNKQQTTKISTAQIGELINEYGTLKISDLPPNSHFIAKIIAPIQVKEITEEPKPGQEPIVRKVYGVTVEYTDPDYEPVQFKIQAGEGAVLRMQEKFPNDSYVDKNAYFSRTKYGSVYPQFINPFEGDLNVSKPTFVKRQGNSLAKAQVPSQAKPVSESVGGWAGDLIMHFASNPAEFNTKYFNTSFKDGVTAPWAFIDEFKDTEKQNGQEGSHSHEDILKIYQSIVDATMESRTN